MNIVLMPVDPVDSGLDFNKYHAYINAMGVIYAEGGEAVEQRQSLRLRPVRQDVGNNPFETRPESGDIMAQGDFSRGQGQNFLHRQGISDPSKAYYMEGFDIEEVGVLTHLPDLDVAAGVLAPRAMTQALGELFIADGTNVKRTTDLATFTSEDPHNAEPATTVLDLASSGDEVFAALGTNGLHRRAGAAWAHYQIAATNVNTGDTRRVYWIRGRPFVVGEGGRSVYEVVVAAPARIGDILPAGWIYESMFTAGNFIYGCAVNALSGLSLLRIFALKSDASGYEWRGDTNMPRGTVIFCGANEFGKVYLGGGRKNKQGGFDPVLFQAVADGDGFIYLEQKLAQGKGAGALDLAVRSIEPAGEYLLVGWSLGPGSPYGAREGLAAIYPARGAFVHAQSQDVAPNPVEAVTDIITYGGKVVFTTSDTLAYEDTTQLRSESFVVSSAGDWSNGGLKSWDLVQVWYRPLAVGQQIDVYYTTKQPKENDWTLLGSATIPGSQKTTFRLNAESTYFALKLVSRATADGTTAPQITGYSVRSNPKPEESEWVLVRTIELVESNRKNEEAEEAFFKPKEDRRTLERLLYSWVTLYEPGGDVWDVRVEDVQVTEIGDPIHEATSGQDEKEGYRIRMTFVGTEAA